MSEAVEPVMRDWRSAGITEPRFDDQDPGWHDEEGYARVVLWLPDGSGTGIQTALDAPLVDRIVAMADQVQEAAIEEALWPDRPTNWPACPDHPTSHPLTARVVGDRGRWVCPQSGRDFREIGTAPTEA